jgi:hypothetical protein
MHSHIFVHRATTKYFSNSFVFKNEIEKEGLPGDSTPDLGAGARRSKRFTSISPSMFNGDNLAFVWLHNFITNPLCLDELQ